MKIRRLSLVWLAACAAIVLSSCSGSATSRALDSIRPADMAFHMKFLSSPEFHGRNTPSAELDIASRYIALVAERIGLKPLMPGGSYYQEVPVEVTAVSPSASRLVLSTASGERTFSFPMDATVGRSFEPAKASGEIVFLGYGLSAPDLGWDDLAAVDVKGKIAVILEAALPDGHPLDPAKNRRLLGGRAGVLRERGAEAVVTIVDQARESRLEEKGLSFDLPERVKVPDIVTAAAGTAPNRPAAPFPQVEVRRGPGAEILGCDRDELDRMSDVLRGGKPVAAQRLAGRRLAIDVGAAIRRAKSFNVVAYLEGADPALRQEYLTISSHHDHNPDREGRIFPGADDNISGVVGMFEVAEALMISKPKRSVIFVWNTAEEKGLAGSYYFVQHCPVPVGKISANLNLDMISRNATNQIFLIGSNKLSSELDASIQAMNTKPGPGLALDYTYEAPGHPDRFFFRSDQYPYIRYGIPAVWFFCGTTPDYHTEGDVEAKVDYAKMERVSELAYLVAMDIGNRPALLKLDLRPEVRTRGPENMGVEWK